MFWNWLCISLTVGLPNLPFIQCEQQTRQKCPLSAHLESQLLSFWGCQSFLGVPRGCRYSILIVKKFKILIKSGRAARGAGGANMVMNRYLYIYIYTYIPDIYLMGWRRQCTYILGNGSVFVRGMHIYIYIMLHVLIEFHFVQTKLHVLFCWYILWELLMALEHGYWGHNVVTWHITEISFHTSYLTLHAPTNHYNWTNRGMFSNSD